MKLKNIVDEVISKRVIKESTGLDCEIYKANDQKWYLGLEDYFRRDVLIYYGPFNSEEEADKYLSANFANPGGMSIDDRGTRPPPTGATRPKRSFHERAPLQEKLILKRYSPKNWLVAVSNLGDRRLNGAETFKAKDILKKAGFRWHTMTDAGGKQINAWVIDASQAKNAMDAINAANKETPVTSQSNSEDQFEELVFDLSTISKKSGLDQKITGFLDRLKQEVDAATASDEYQRYINFAKRFRTYSFSNQMLIWIQKPNATRVAGYRAWESMNRTVKKGAAGIAIFVPMFYKGKGKINKKGSEDIQDTGLDKEVDSQTLRGFTVGHVFDISDTQLIPGKEDLAADTPQWHSTNEPDVNADKISSYVEDILQQFGVKYTQDTDRRGAQGYAAGGNHINISSGVSGVNKTSTLVHELAHTLLHFPNSLFSDEQMQHIPKNVKEFQAEAVAAAVLDEYGFPYKHSANYIALWNQKVPEIAEYSNMVLKAARYIIDEIDARAEGTDEPNKA